MAPFHYFLDEAKRLDDVVRLSSAGISVFQAQPEAIRALMLAKEGRIDEDSERLTRAHEDADLAKREVESGFPILHSWAVIGLWALLEATIRNFVAEWLRHKRTAWRAEPIQRLRVKLGDYESIPRNQRYSFVVALLERDLAAGLKSGVSRFEAMLDPFGLSGDVHAEVRRQMYEFNQVRNVIAHNAGKVDRRLSDACPWLESKVGDEFLISADMYRKYYGASAVYITLIICRTGEFFGVDMSDAKKTLTEGFESQYEKKQPPT